MVCKHSLFCHSQSLIWKRYKGKSYFIKSAVYSNENVKKKLNVY